MYLRDELARAVGQNFYLRADESWECSIDGRYNKLIENEFKTFIILLELKTWNSLETIWKVSFQGIDVTKIWIFNSKKCWYKSFKNVNEMCH